ncbi:MAG: c-type cytochrome [Gammaproteobacteria bacterium]
MKEFRFRKVLSMGLALVVCSVAAISAYAAVAPFGMAERKPVPVADAPGTAELAQASAESPLYAVHCIACHGGDGKGVEALGVSLVDSELVAGSSDAEIIAFLKVGRMPDDAATITGRPMPAFAWMTDEDLDQLAGHLKGLQ